MSVPRTGMSDCISFINNLDTDLQAGDNDVGVNFYFRGLHQRRQAGKAGAQEDSVGAWAAVQVEGDEIFEGDVHIAIDRY